MVFTDIGEFVYTYSNGNHKREVFLFFNPSFSSNNLHLTTDSRVVSLTKPPREDRPYIRESSSPHDSGVHTTTGSILPVLPATPKLMLSIVTSITVPPTITVNIIYEDSFFGRTVHYMLILVN